MNELGFEEKEESYRIVINRAEKRNSLTPDILIGIKDIFNNIIKGSQNKPVVITGVGNDYFCSGYDINLIPLEDPHQAAEFALNKPLDLAVKAIFEHPYPTFCLLNGSVYGGGCEIAFACDFRYAVEGIKMCMPPAKIGLIYSLNGINRIGSIIGFQNLKRILMMAELISFDEMKSMGAVDKHAYNLDAITDLLSEDLKKIKCLSPISVAGHKKILNQLQKKQIENKTNQIANELILDAYLSKDAKEGKRAFLEKRPPEFNNN